MAFCETRLDDLFEELTNDRKSFSTPKHGMFHERGSKLIASGYDCDQRK